MELDIQHFNNLSDYDNVLITDEKGYVSFYDVADLNVLKELGPWPEVIIGKHVTSFYTNLSHENSTIMTVLKNKTPLLNCRQEMVTRIGSKIESYSSTFPIEDNDRMIGAIEFSKRYFKKENIQSLEKYATHKIFRKNNTIFTIDDLISKNPTMNKIKDRIKKIAKTNSSVLVHGKTGTGKEIVAQAIHNLSDRYTKPFLSLNCSTIPQNLMESTLFGTVKGSFTGAENMAGLFEQAEGGTLFLDEINSLDMHLQVKLLKAIEEKRIRRLGGSRNIDLDIRLISATNEDPYNLVVEKNFREDLFYRLSVVQIDLPELKDRREDIEVLLRYYLDFFNSNMNMSIDSVEQEVIDCFNRYSWPGNVREFRNAIETAYNFVSSNRITMDDIPNRIKNGKGTSQKITDASQPTEGYSLKTDVENYEKEIIYKAIKEEGGVLAKTARQLGISKQSLKYKLKKYGLR
ncbi:sigma-54 interaction domain-containing protein [Virgibacillus sediminis]|uniref:Sigma-54 interaction domain-containing protein n=1 Tax=Virgibacillus sediminis TaxID=202260 RepID=A0ABV7A579_9BACI